MRKPRCALLLFVFLILGLSLGVPAQDVPETTYDESESLPYEGTPSISTKIAATVAHPAHELLTYSQFGLGARPLSNTARVLATEAHGLADARVSSALLCTLRC
jgi:hypothetical protein